MLPSSTDGTLKTAGYGAEAGGRALGVATMPNLVPDPEKRAKLERSGTRILGLSREAMMACLACVQYEQVDARAAMGKGRGVDRGWDAFVAGVADGIRTSLPDRNTTNPEYRLVFVDGTAAAYQKPTIKQDPEVAGNMRRSVEASNVPRKADIVRSIDEVLPVVESAATAVRGAEDETGRLFEAEMTARKKLVDALWEERKSVEQTLGRGGRGLARFIFFDFRTSRGSSETVEFEADPTSGLPGPK